MWPLLATLLCCALAAILWRARRDFAARQRSTTARALLSDLSGHTDGGSAAVAAERKTAIASLPFSHKFVVAPMVDQSDLPFRMLCRKHDADLCYTQMLYSERFATDAEYRKEFTTCKGDRPLAVQFAANDAKVLLAAAKHVEDVCDGVDINLGCPQQRAYDGRFGSYLLDRQHWPLIRDMVRTLAENLRVPVFCKIRLLPTLKETLELCHLLEDAGCALIAVHGRQRGSPRRRREGPANLTWVGRIAAALRVPVISNGNVRCFADVAKNAASTGAAGVMSAEAVLQNPALFSGRTPDPFALCEEYLASCAEHGWPPLRWVQDHVKNITRPLLRDKQDLKAKLRGEGVTGVDDVRAWIQELRQRCAGKGSDGGAGGAGSAGERKEESKDGAAAGAEGEDQDDDAGVDALFSG